MRRWRPEGRRYRRLRLPGTSGWTSALAFSPDGALLASAALLPIAGCSGPSAPTASGPTTTDPSGSAPTASGPTATGPTAPGPSTTASASVPGRPAGPVTAELAALELTVDLRLGVYAHDTGTGATVTHRAGERCGEGFDDFGVTAVDHDGHGGQVQLVGGVLGVGDGGDRRN